MCVRTKTSYGCGHEFKSTEECYSSRCHGMQRFHYIKDGDCRSCKYGGGAVTRGRDGKGRYAREMQRRGDSRSNSREGSPETAQHHAVEIDGSASPWAAPNPSSRREKEWHSPSRRRADDAWLKEHDQRMSDLESRLRKLPIRSPSISSSSTVSSPRRHSRREQSDREDNYDDNKSLNRNYELESERNHRRLDETGEKLHQEIRSINEEISNRSLRRGISDQHEYKYIGYESTPSIPRSYKATPSHYTYDVYDHYDEGYGSYESRTSPSNSHGRGHYRARTEPYTYSSQTPRVYDLPHSKPYGAYYSGFDIVTRSPSKYRRY